MAAYYNERDKKAAAWLRELISAGHIAPGDVDERNIEDVCPDDLVGYDQCHFFSGIGGWPLALRRAGVADTERLWTGSCPCQPLSAAGQRKGFADERHLWPAWHWLIEQCRPVLILGEQVASPLGLQWLDLVSADLEGSGYAAGAVDLCAAGQCVAYSDSEEGDQTLEWIRGAVQSCPDPDLAAELRDFAEYARREVGYGPPHIRQRLYWVGRLADIKSGGRGECGHAAFAWRGGHADGGRDAQRMAVTDGGNASAEREQRSGEQRQQSKDRGTGTVANTMLDGARPGPSGSVRPQGTTLGDDGCVSRSSADLGRCGEAVAVADATHADGRPGISGTQKGTWTPGRRGGRPSGGSHTHDLGNPSGSRLEIGPQQEVGCGDLRHEGPTAPQAGAQGCDWIICTDGKARPTQPGLQPLAHGVSGRVGLLRGYGNAIHVETAVSFIKAVFGEV